ncbi:MAG TPA: hypothetical protein VKX28_30660 [Xanthobacteraceae bacterium]|nr:hypothetical protein [Xanthobacteraceae bacterium]
MTSFRAIVTLTVIAAACLLGAVSAATAQQPGSQAAISRCPQTADQYAAVIKQLTSDAAHARALANQNAMLEPDADYYEAQLAATRQCAPTVASLSR